MFVSRQIRRISLWFYVLFFVLLFSKLREINYQFWFVEFGFVVQWMGRYQLGFVVWWIKKVSLWFCVLLFGELRNIIVSYGFVSCGFVSYRIVGFGFVLQWIGKYQPNFVAQQIKRHLLCFVVQRIDESSTTSLLGKSTKFCNKGNFLITLK